jgi:hypothetical protein
LRRQAEILLAMDVEDFKAGDEKDNYNKNVTIPCRYRTQNGWK